MLDFDGETIEGEGEDFLLRVHTLESTLEDLKRCILKEFTVRERREALGLKSEVPLKVNAVVNQSTSWNPSKEVRAPVKELEHKSVKPGCRLCYSKDHSTEYCTEKCKCRTGDVHGWRKCPNKRGWESGSSNWVAGIRCLLCRKWGHYAVNCPQRCRCGVGNYHDIDSCKRKSAGGIEIYQKRNLQVPGVTNGQNVCSSTRQEAGGVPLVERN